MTTNSTVTNTNQATIPTTNYETVSFRDQNHAIYLEIPDNWKYTLADDEIGERIPLIDFDLSTVEMPVNALVTYYSAGGSTLEEWTELHLVNDIKREFGEDFTISSFDTGKVEGVEITGTNKFHPLWQPEPDDVWSYTYYYYLNDDKIYEFELRLSQEYLSDFQNELVALRDSVYFGEPFDLDEWETYTSEKNGFTVKYPSKWKPSENWEQIGGFVGFDENENLFEGHEVTISTLSQEAYTNSLAGQARLENVQISYPEIGAIPAVRIGGKVAEPTGFWNYSDSVFVMRDGVGIEMAYREMEFNLESREFFSQMIRTFEFIE